MAYASKMADDLHGNNFGSGSADYTEDWEKYAEANELKLTSDKKYNDIRNRMMRDSALQQARNEANDLNLSTKRRAEAAKRAKEIEDRINKRAAEAARAYEKNAFAQASAAKRAQMLKDEGEALARRKETLSEQFNEEIAILQAEGASKEQLMAKEQEYADKQKALIEQITQKKREQLALEKNSGMESLDAFNEKVKHAKSNFGNSFLDSINEIKDALKEIDLNDLAEAAEKQREAAEEDFKMSRDELAAESEKLAEMKANGASDEEIEAQQAVVNAKKSETTEKEKELVEKQRNEAILKSLKEVTNAIKDGYNAAFVEAENILTSYMGHIDARLQGSEKSFNGIMDKVNSNLFLSPFVKTQDVIKEMREAVDKGIVYNLEQRAFLNTIKDKIANTFDAFNGNLTRLIRLQQADTTAARLGMEAALTKFLNEMFEDSSYLQNNQSQQVIGSLIDASSTMTKESAAEFEFVVNKWMGSLHSVGLDSNTINSLVQSINYLATGDVESLSSNTQMQTLLAMSASKAGLDYSKLLLEGLNASNTNKLLESMVGYLAEIASGSENMVVRSAYGGVLGMNMSDFSAITNLSSSDLSNISSVMMNYSDLNDELSDQLGQLIKRTSLPEMMSNLYNNAVFGMAQDTVNNPVMYAMTKMLNFMESQKINMNIPFISAMGNGVNLNANVQDLLRLGLGVGQAFNLVGNIVGGLGSVGGLNLDMWGAKETTNRGSGLGFTSSTSLTETSSSTYVTNSSSKDMQNSALNTATDDAEETGEITNKNHKTEYTFDDFYKATIGSSAKSWVTTQDTHIRNVYKSDDKTYLSVKDKEQITFLSDTKAEIVEESKVKVYDSLVKEVLDTISASAGSTLGADLNKLTNAFTTGNDTTTAYGTLLTSNDYLSKIKDSLGGDTGITLASILTALATDNGALYSEIAGLKTSTANIEKSLTDSSGSMLSPLVAIKDSLADKGTTHSQLSSMVTNLSDLATAVDKSDTGASTLRVSLISTSTAVPVVIVDEMGKEAKKTSSQLITDAFKSAFKRDSGTYIRVLSAYGNDVLPVDTELISGGDSAPEFKTSDNTSKSDWTSSAEANNRGYRPGAINWN